MLTNLLFTFIGCKDVGADKVRAYCDAAIAMVSTDPLALHTVAFVVILSRVLKRTRPPRRGDRGVPAGDQAWLLQRRVLSQHDLRSDPDAGSEIAQASVARLDKIIDGKPKNISAKPGTAIPVFDNAAVVHLLLGDNAMALRYVALCKEYGYTNFAKMPGDPNYASVKDDPEFKRLFD